MRKLLVVILLLALGAGGAWALLRRTSDHPGGFILESRVTSSGQAFSAALEETVGAPLRPGHRIEVLPNGKVFDALIADVGRARESVHIEMYIWTDGAAATSLLEALRARKGSIACRILLDGVGSFDRGKETDGKIKDAGCDLRLFRKEATTARNHRKLAIVDGRTGYTGGFGVDARWLGNAEDADHWRDTNVRVEGAAVTDMQKAFTEDWQEATGELLPGQLFPETTQDGAALAAFVRSTASPVVTRAERLTQLAIAAAHQRLWISNAYFVPGKPVLELLGRRAKEGVDVRLLVPGRSSDSKLAFLWQQREYGELQKRGVRVWEYDRTMMHAKTMVVDSSLAVIGSVNLDPLSLDRLEEGALVVQDAAVVAELAREFEADCARAEPQK